MAAGHLAAGSDPRLQARLPAPNLPQMPGSEMQGPPVFPLPREP